MSAARRPSTRGRYSRRTIGRFEALAAFKQCFAARPRISACRQSDRGPTTLELSMAQFGGTRATS
jgi:hypothetical protein